MDLRYKKKATIITANLDFSNWYDLFQRKPLVEALLDRPQHRRATIRIISFSPGTSTDSHPPPQK